MVQKVLAVFLAAALIGIVQPSFLSASPDTAPSEIPSDRLLLSTSNPEALTEALDSIAGAEVLTTSPHVVSVSAPANEIEGVRALPEVTRVEPDIPLTPQALPGGTWYLGGRLPSPTTPVAAFGVNSKRTTSTTPPSAWVAVIDTGVDISHPALAGRVWQNPKEKPNGVDDDGNGLVDDVHGWDTAMGDGNVFKPEHDSTHGTAVAGLVAGAEVFGAPIAPADGVGVLPLKINGPDGMFASAAIAAIDYVIDIKRRHKVNIVAINASWYTGSSFSYGLRDAIWRAGDAGIFFVASAGNYGNDNDITPAYPASYNCSTWWRAWDCVVAVGANDGRGELSKWGSQSSSFGATSVDLVAPGSQVRSLEPGGGTRMFAGTSAAAPLVANALASCATNQTSPNLTSIRSALLASTAPTPATTGKTVTSGRLDIGALTQACGTLPHAVFGEVYDVTASDTGTASVTGRAGASTDFTMTFTVDGAEVPSTPLTSLPGEFKATLPVPPGVREVCVTATAKEAVIEAGCRTVRVLPPGPPLGELNVARFSSRWDVWGWVLDPATSAPVTASVSVNGQPLLSFPADELNDVVASDFPGHAANHGFAQRLQALPPGRHRICLRAAGVDVSCQDVWSFPDGNPRGSFDAVKRTSSGWGIFGWALDPDTSNQTTLHIYVDGKFHSLATTSIPRPDVTRAYPGYNTQSGFEITVPKLSAGQRSVCVYAINEGPGQLNPLLGCRNVVVRTGNPFGSVDSMRRTSSTNVRVAGWALDPDTTSPIPVHVYAGARFVGSFNANTTRTDVGRAYPGYGDNHGFDFTVNARRGEIVCVYAINRGAGSVNTLLGCRVM